MISSGRTGDRAVPPLPAALGRLLSQRPQLLLLVFLPLFLAVPLLAPYNDNLFDDQAGYLGIARYLVAGHYLSGRDDLVGGGHAYPNLWFGPGLPLVLAPFVALHVPVEVIRLLGPLFLFAAVLLFHRLLRLAVSERAALVGAAALGLYLPLYTTIAFLHSEVLALLLVVGALYALGLYLRRGRRRQLVAASVCLAWLALTRIAFGWILAVLLVVYAVAWLFRRRTYARRLAAAHALALVLCVPWLAYTYSVTGHPFYWGSSGALSLYWISSPYAQDRGDWHGADSVFSDPRLAPHRPFFRSLEGRDLNAQNRKLEHAALTNIRGHPGKFAENVAANVSRMLFNVPYSFKPLKATALLYALPAALLLTALAAAGARALRRPGPPLPPEGLAVVVLAAATFALHAVLAGYPRLLFPVVPAAFWLVTVWWASPRAQEPARA